MPTHNLTVVYIMGYGRSGSTLLDILLSNHPEIVSAGALVNFPDWLIHDYKCACGLSLEQCEFWGPIVQSYLAICPNMSELKTVQMEVEARRYLSKLLGGTLPSSLTNRYGTRLEALFNTIHDKTGKKHIVDSSKSARMVAGRAYSLGAYAHLNTKVIYLVRDARAVVWSALQRAGSPERRQSNFAVVRALNALAGWILTNTNCLRIVKYLGEDNVMLLRYEDMVAQPDGVLWRLGDFLELSMQPVLQKINLEAPLAIGHNLGGNRLRFSGSTTIKPDFAWRHELPILLNALFWLPTWPLQTRFGYSYHS